MINHDRKEGGWGLTSVMLCIFAVIVVGIIAVRIVPIYLEHITVNSSLESLVDEALLYQRNPGAVKNLLMNRFAVNSITQAKRKDIVVKKTNREMTVRVHYQVRQHLFANVDVVLNFDNEVAVPAR